MKFCVISHVVHKRKNNKFYAYGPYVREVNLWLQSGMELIVVAPCDESKSPGDIDLAYETDNIHFIEVSSFNLISIGGAFKSIRVLPCILKKIYLAMSMADHIHLRCPGNMGLLGSMVQILFPSKKKTAKYAGNWDWNSRQPWSYRVQQRILRNTFLTRNMTVLVYGDWPDKTRNILPFFTASYSESDMSEVVKPDFSNGVNMAFIGTLTANKSPMTALNVLQLLIEQGIQARLTFCGDGPERVLIEKQIRENKLQKYVELLGNVSAEKVKIVLQNSHFLVFISKSEGWPKAVAEAMWWGCVPITTAVSCVPQMVGNGARGFLVKSNPAEITRIITDIIISSDDFSKMSNASRVWSRKYTVENFQQEIRGLL